ncbi:MAG: VCBS repeat-containing protein [Nannocystaceae bacterium]
MLTLDDGGESITDSDGETDSDTEPPSTTSPPPVECIDSSTCEPGWECIDGECVPYDYCADGGCCDYGYGGDCCYDGCCYGECYYYECYSDAECGPGGLCESFQECTWVDPLAECGDPPALLGLPLLEDAPEQVVSLSFVDADGDAAADLVVGTEGGAATLFRGSDGPPQASPLPFPGGAPLLDVASADLTGDGLPDLVGADALGRIIVLAADGAGGFSPASETPGVGPITRLSVLDWDGDATPDLATLGGDGLVSVFLGDGAGGFAGVFALDTDNGAYTLATGTFGADAFDDVLVHTEERGSLFWGNAVGDAQPDGELAPSGHGRRGVVAADFDGAGVTDIAGHTPIETFDEPWALIEGWRNGLAPVQRQALLAPVSVSDRGDVDGDGLTDAVAVGEWTLSILHGSPEGGDAPLFACHDRLTLEYPARLLALGDYDGDGLADIAVADDSRVTLLRRLAPE